MFTTGGAQEHFFKKYVHIFVRLHSFSKNVLLGTTNGEYSIGPTFYVIYILLNMMRNISSSIEHVMNNIIYVRIKIL